MADNRAPTLVVEPAQCTFEDQQRTHFHHEKLAREAWDEFCRCNQGHAFSSDYAGGFAAGFADYLDAGGTGDPPPLPPQRYWDQHCPPRSQDWFAGFQTGAGMAQRSQLRQYVIVPTTTQVCGSRNVPVYPSTPLLQTALPQTQPAESVPMPVPATLPPAPTMPPPPTTLPAPITMPPAPTTMPAPNTAPTPAPVPNTSSDVPPRPADPQPPEAAPTTIPITGIVPDSRVERLLSDPPFPNDMPGDSHESR
jgi:hypothetical protein